MKPHVYVACKIPDETESYLAKHVQYRKWEGPGAIPYEVLLEELAEADGLLTSGNKIGLELLSRAPKLKAVSTMSVGYNHFDLDAMKERGIIGTHTPNVLDDTVADLILALMLAVCRRVPELDTYVKQGQWKKGDNDVLFGLDMHHKKLGIIGMGRIGEAVAQRAHFGFGMDIVYHNRHRKPDAEHKFGAKYAEMNDLLHEADFVVLMTPLTPQTRHLFGRNEFAQMKPTGIFINASRGPVVDEEALTEALQQGQIFGAGLDVFEREPVQPDHTLLQLQNVVTLPHIGSATAQTRNDMAMLAAENLVSALLGADPQNVVPELRK
ncbi:2-hydroxyacid dehydrogenase [Paenibacillus physcomitrellae]|uniref:Bifunctional glyoxylate/hydroxypyruvate reductase B n=1 Tax=Paenibacillus physcomitrellae TaxID=1619311 RepID=A0ABQ1G6E2_9BACL|nr:D-glycerate dehydrogenase [Paenibacillus physcomitrellae]GGA37600.1 bifunctional glyoxylate/hydroxypyruvate reductase B [Paenibacillus physcomitrellae]